MTYLVSGFRSTVPESAGWHSHIPEPDEDEVCPECDGLGVVPDGEDAAMCPTCHGARRCYDDPTAEERAETAVCRAEFYFEEG